jgi:hypothetical protein
MRALLLPPSRRRFVPALERLEGRCTPAVVSYNATLQQLNITANSDDGITISQPANRPTGFLQVTDRTGTIFSGGAFVRHIRADLRAAQFSSLTLAARTRLAGNLTAIGGSIAGSATIGAEAVIGGNFAYYGTGTAADTVEMGTFCAVGGGVNLYLGEGRNFARLRGLGLGSVLVQGGAGEDNVNAAGAVVHGSAVFQLGNGLNGFGVSGGSLTVAGNLTYSGGNGADTFAVVDGNPLFVGGYINLVMGPATGADGANSAIILDTRVVGSLYYTGGNGGDFLSLEDDTLVGKDLIASPREGRNEAKLNGVSAGVRVLGSLSYTGGNGEDEITVDDAHIGLNMTVALKDNNFRVDGQELDFDGSLNVVGGSLTVTGGRHDDVIDVENVLIGMSVTINSGVGGNDRVNLQSSVVSGNAAITTGAGADQVSLSGFVMGWLTVSTAAGNDLVDADGIEVHLAAVLDVGAGADTIRIEEGSVAGDSSFGGPVTFIGGTGIDTLRLSGGTGRVRFGGKVTYSGGIESDTFSAADTVFEVASAGSW